MGSTPCKVELDMWKVELDMWKVELDMWIRKCGKRYDYIAVFVDNPSIFYGRSQIIH